MSEKKRQLTSLVIDRSGSINSCLSDMQGAVDNFLKERKGSDDTKERIAISHFDTTYQLVKGFTKPVEYAHEEGGEGFYFKIVPRGGTALYDAIGKNIVYAEDYVKNNPKFTMAIKNIVIVTDGYENASTEYNQTSIKRLVESKTQEEWNFIYLGANQDAVFVAKSMGFSPDLSLSYNTNNSGVAMVNVSNVLTRGASGQGYTFSSAERSSSVA